MRATLNEVNLKIKERNEYDGIRASQLLARGGGHNLAALHTSIDSTRCGL